MWVQVPSPAVSSRKIREHSSIAQSVEHAAVNRAVVGSSPTRGVLQKWRNWQTRTVQVRVVAIPCGFDSHLLHQWKRRAKVLRFFCFIGSYTAKVSELTFFHMFSRKHIFLKKSKKQLTNYMELDIIYMLVRWVIAERTVRRSGGIGRRARFRSVW